MKLASFYVACCKLFEQMESYKEVTIYNTVLDLHKGSCGPIFTLVIKDMNNLTNLIKQSLGPYEVIIFERTGAVQKALWNCRQGSHSQKTISIVVNSCLKINCFTLEQLQMETYYILKTFYVKLEPNDELIK